jgi:methionyl-tRNA formyltransferase
MTRAVVFAYHNVGARCLRVLLAGGVDVPLVVTHDDDPAETRWFERVADVAHDLSLPCVAPADVNAPDVVRRVAALAPDFVFSFYFRQMLGPPILAAAGRGALNLHGSLLPHYRGRAPINWAILRGERRTGATLHHMAAKPDAGDIVAQQAVPILPDDTARDVFDKVTVAAEICLDGVLPALIAGTAPRRPNDIARGSYFGGRTPEDGRIDWRKPAVEIHNLVRAVAPPYPGALTSIGGVPARVLRTRMLDASAPPGPALLAVRDAPAPTSRPPGGGEASVLVAHCGGGGVLRILDLELDGRVVSASALGRRFGATELPLL